MTVLFRKGDIVSLRGVVKFDQGDNEKLVHVDIIGDVTSRPIVEAESLTMEEASFRVGDAVTWKDMHILRVGTVLAIAGDRLWVRDSDEDGGMETLGFSNCKRAAMPLPEPLDF